LRKISKDTILLYVFEEISLILILIFFGIFAYLRPKGMLNINTIIFTIYSAVPLGFIVLAESIALFSGNFDLSVDQITGFSALAAGRLLMFFKGFPPVLSVFLPMIFGAGCGSLNGLLVGGLRLNPFIATLGNLMFFKGMKLVISPSGIWADSLPPFYLSIGQSIPATIIIFGIILIFLWFIFRYVRFGVNIYAVGGNPQSAHMLGINIGRTYFFVYVLDGALCGLASLFYTGYVSAIPVNLGEGTMILAFAGAVIGGVSLRGGTGSIINAFWGVLLLGFIEAGLAMFAVSSEVRMASYGILVVTAIIIARFKDSLRNRILKPKLTGE